MRSRVDAQAGTSPAGVWRPSRRPLVVTADPRLLDDVLRLAAAAGVEVDVAPDVAGARLAWPQAALVLVGDDVAERVARARLPRRRDVVVVGADLDDSGVWQRAVGVQAEHVALLPDAEAWLGARLLQSLDGAPPGRVVAVLGGRGGAGASTLAAALSVTAMRLGRRAMLVDADPLGGGADMLFGGEHVPGLRWPDLIGANGAIGGHALRAALPQVGDLAVLSYDRGDFVELDADAMASVLSAAAHGCELVVVDLPRRFSEATEVALSASDLALVVVPAEVRAAAAAARVTARAAALANDVRLVVRGPAPGGLDGADIAVTLGVPLAGELRPEPRLEAALERGEVPAGRGVGPLADLCAALIGDLCPPEV